MEAANELCCSMHCCDLKQQTKLSTWMNGLPIFQSKLVMDAIRIFEFSLYVFTELIEFSDKKGLFKPATSCIRDKGLAKDPTSHR